MIRSALTVMLLAAAAPLAAQTVAITGGTVALGDGSEPIPGGTVVIRDGRIVSAGANAVIPRGAEMIDARGKWVKALDGTYSRRRLGVFQIPTTIVGRTLRAAINRARCSSTSHSMP